MPNLSNFSGKTVWITGASSGIGKSLALLISELGGILILSSRNAAALAEVAALCSNPDNHLVLPIDLAKCPELPALVARIIKEYGRVDILINCSGVSQKSFSIDTLPSVERSIMEVNFWGTVNISKAVLPYMMKRNQGLILVFSSVLGKVGVSGRSSYAASKHALHGYFDSLRADLMKHKYLGISIKLICLGFIKTSISSNYLNEMGQPLGFIDKDHQSAMSAKKCAQTIVKAMRSNRNEVYIGGKELLAVLLKRLFPRLFLKFSYRY